MYTASSFQSRRTLWFRTVLVGVPWHLIDMLYWLIYHLVMPLDYLEEVRKFQIFCRERGADLIASSARITSFIDNQCESTQILPIQRSVVHSTVRQSFLYALQLICEEWQTQHNPSSTDKGQAQVSQVGEISSPDYSMLDPPQSNLSSSTSFRPGQIKSQEIPSGTKGLMLFEVGAPLVPAASNTPPFDPDALSSESHLTPNNFHSVHLNFNILDDDFGFPAQTDETSFDQIIPSSVFDL